MFLFVALNAVLLFLIQKVEGIYKEQYVVEASLTIEVWNIWIWKKATESGK